MLDKNFGIEETLEVLDAGIALGNAVGKSLADDGKITWTEYPNFLPVLMKAPKAINDISLVPKEMADLDDEEREEIKTFVQEKLDLSDDNLEEKVELIFSKVMKTFVATLELVQAVRS
jgi:hypothetical protein